MAVNEAPPSRALTADVTLFYQFRRTRNGRSYVEGQQGAEYTSRQSRKTTVTIVPAVEVTKRSWRVVPSARPDNPIFGLNPLQNSLPLDFTSFEQATAFAAWLNHQGAAFFANATPSVGKSGVRLTSGSGVSGRWTPITRSRFVAQPFAEPDDVLARKCERMNASYAAAGTIVRLGQEARPAPDAAPPTRRRP